VLDTNKNSRIYLPHPPTFNDPFDVSPVVVHGGDPNDPEYFRALETEMRRMHKPQGGTPAGRDPLRRRKGVSVHDLPRAAEDDLRKKLRDDVRILCLSADRLPSFWSHYADNHCGLYLHFRCRPGAPFGLPRQVRYRKKRYALSTLLHRQSSGSVMDRLVFNKAKFWFYESEYRIIVSEARKADPILKKGY
jgi:hypothetical protein